VARQRIPDDVLSLAHARARSREVRDWAEADRLRTQIEDAGWRVVDRGTDFALTPASAADIAEGDRVLFGSSASVPSRLTEAPAGLATVVLVATDWPDDLNRAIAGLRATPDGLSVVIVADGPSDEQAEALDTLIGEARADPSSLPIEVVWTSERLGHGAALNIGIRRAVGPVVVVLDTSVEPTGDIATPLARALDDPSVAVAGGSGMVSTDMRRFEDAPPGDVDAIRGDLQAFRRTDAEERGPVDEGFWFPAYLDIWWSLVLRDGGDAASRGRAVSLLDLPIERHVDRGQTSLPRTGRDRKAKRNFYRMIDRFGTRRDLLIRN
jgi:hypothetical protein